jgi:hypothetical protein
MKIPKGLFGDTNFWGITIWAAGVAALYHDGLTSWAIFLFAGGIVSEIRKVQR